MITDFLDLKPRVISMEPQGIMRLTFSLCLTCWVSVFQPRIVYESSTSIFEEWLWYIHCTVTLRDWWESQLTSSLQICGSFPVSAFYLTLKWPLYQIISFITLPRQPPLNLMPYVPPSSPPLSYLPHPHKQLFLFFQPLITHISKGEEMCISRFY